jgi:hypothetical protein
MNGLVLTQAGLLARHTAFGVSQKKRDDDDDVIVYQCLHQLLFGLPSHPVILSYQLGAGFTLVITRYESISYIT